MLPFFSVGKRNPFALALHRSGGGVSHSMHTHKHKKGNRKATLFPHHTHTHTRSHRGHTHHLMCDVYFHFAFIMCPLSPQPEHSISLPENGKSFRFAKALASQTNNADAFPPHRIIHRTRRRAEECHLLNGLAQGKVLGVISHSQQNTHTRTGSRAQGKQGKRQIIHTRHRRAKKQSPGSGKEKLHTLKHTYVDIDTLWVFDGEKEAGRLEVG